MLVKLHTQWTNKRRASHDS